MSILTVRETRLKREWALQQATKLLEEYSPDRISGYEEISDYNCYDSAKHGVAMQQADVLLKLYHLLEDRLQKAITEGLSDDDPIMGEPE